MSRMMPMKLGAPALSTWPTDTSAGKIEPSLRQASTSRGASMNLASPVRWKRLM
jgi:hypothetical protein